jgi:hypothetical protein
VLGQPTSSNNWLVFGTNIKQKATSGCSRLPSGSLAAAMVATKNKQTKNFLLLLEKTYILAFLCAQYLGI